MVAGLTHADMTDILVYKGELRFVARAGEARDDGIVNNAADDRNLEHQLVQPLGHRAGFVRIGRREAARAEIRAPHAAACVDAGAENEAEVIGGRRGVEPGDVGKHSLTAQDMIGESR